MNTNKNHYLWNLCSSVSDSFMEYGMADRRRVVITGMGAVTPLGLTLDETWQGLLQARSGIGAITLFDASDLSVRVAGEVKGFNATTYLDRKLVRRTSRTTHLAIAAATMALHDARLDV